jgi:hypothetical protein
MQLAQATPIELTKRKTFRVLRLGTCNMVPSSWVSGTLRPPPGDLSPSPEQRHNLNLSSRNHNGLTTTGIYIWQIQLRVQRKSSVMTLACMLMNPPHGHATAHRCWHPSLTKTKNKSPHHLGRRSKHLFDWMAHAANLSKGATPYTRISASVCKFCEVPETQQHINVACTHPPHVETRSTFRRAIDEFFLC